MPSCIFPTCLTPGCIVTDKIKLSVYPRVIGGTVISWAILPGANFTEQAVYQVQVGKTGHNYASDWQNVGPSRTNASAITDFEYRNVGSFANTFYRVLVNDVSGLFVSNPVIPAIGHLSVQQQRLYDEIIRREMRRYVDPAQPAGEGYLLKVRYQGTPCPECIDPDTGTRVKHDCSTCFGAGYEFGYYQPYPCFYLDIGNYASDLKMLPEQGMSNPGLSSGARFLNLPPVNSWDVWVDKDTDDRWMFGQISSLTTINRFPIICQAAVTRLDYNHPVYKIPVNPPSLTLLAELPHGTAGVT